MGSNMRWRLARPRRMPSKSASFGSLSMNDVIHHWPRLASSGRYATIVLAAACLGGCDRAQGWGSSQAAEDAGGVSLALVGYNYTNRSIESFEVDGQGGGNVAVSSPTSGGGGTVCCVTHIPGDYVWKVVVRWQSGGCYYHLKSHTSSEVYDVLHPFFKEREVTVDGKRPAKPNNLEVHFYPDGTIQAAVTEQESYPRLSLDEKRKDRTRFPRCPDDRKPAE